MLLEDAPASPAVWGRDYGREGNSSRNRASPCSIINRCIMEKERDGHQPSDSFVSLSKSPSSQASEGRHGRFDAEASCLGNGNISRCKSSSCQRNPNEKEGQQGAPGAAWGGGYSRLQETGTLPDSLLAPFLHCSSAPIGGRQFSQGPVGSQGI